MPKGASVKNNCSDPRPHLRPLWSDDHVRQPEAHHEKANLGNREAESTASIRLVPLQLVKVESRFRNPLPLRPEHRGQQRLDNVDREVVVLDEVDEQKCRCPIQTPALWQTLGSKAQRVTKGPRYGLSFRRCRSGRTGLALVVHRATVVLVLFFF